MDSRIKIILGGRLSLSLPPVSILVLMDSRIKILQNCWLIQKSTKVSILVLMDSRIKIFYLYDLESELF